MRISLKKNMEIILILCIVILGLSVSSNTVLGDIDPFVTLDPVKPAPESTVVFTVTIIEEDVSEVWLQVSECSADLGICFPDSKQNVSMERIEASIYEYAVKFVHDDATYIQYGLAIKNESGWLDIDEITVDLDLESNNDNSGNGENNDTPGFEFIPFLAAISIGILLFRRKRF